MCPVCEHALDQCICGTEDEILGSGNVRIWLETKGRNGKGVTVVKELPLTHSELEKLAKELKKSCGTGGAVKGVNIEIQGDQRQKLLAELTKRGFSVKLAGG
ncbi:translation initiation factor 1 (eIF-1/SUI1)-related protein [Gynuella sunshinyii YC6258]|uniref:Translation initiation factor 1 (EIF-1/SUI1)-related protein n=2 Tax=Gynuella sunshinyii TaxID=1445505 RepID=A0A0C5VKS7_9GAMM|nr:translation initiation factor 1 (eIF-1/SUI1)-related protein [Gynuella sunshinyii YC6258]